MVEFVGLPTPLCEICCDTFAVGGLHLHGISSSPSSLCPVGGRRRSFLSNLTSRQELTSTTIMRRDCFLMLYSLKGNGQVDYVTGRLVQEYFRSNYGNPVYQNGSLSLCSTGGTTPCITIRSRMA